VALSNGGALPKTTGLGVGSFHMPDIIP